MDMKDLSVERLCERTASREPVPGGGSVVAMTASFAAALAVMVARLTEGKKGFEDVAPDMRSLVEAADALRIELLSDIQRDSDAYQGFMQALALPKTTEDEKAARREAMQKALKAAAEIPLTVAEKATRILPWARAVVEKGNPNAATDGLVAALLSRAALRGAILNVRTNLQSISDKDFVAALQARCVRLEADALEEEKAILLLRPDLA